MLTTVPPSDAAREPRDGAREPRPPPEPDWSSCERFVRRVVAKVMSRRDDADDVVQMTLFVRWNRPPKRGERTDAWLAKVARDFVIDHFRRVQRRKRRERVAAREEALPSASDLAETEFWRKEVVVALARLEPRYRDAVMLRFFDGLPPRDVARALGIPVETARTRIKRGLNRLRADLQRSRRAGGASEDA